MVLEAKSANNLGQGCQPYINDEDTQDVDLSLPVIEQLFNNISKSLHGSILDVGCGNGRLNDLHRKRFDKVFGIDKFRDPNPKYIMQNFEFARDDIFSFCHKVNVVLFMGTFYLHYDDGYEATLNKAKELLIAGGSIVIIDDVNRNSLETKPGYYNLKQICSNLGLRISYKENKNKLSLFVIVDKYSTEDAQNHITQLWGNAGEGHYSCEEDMCFNFFKGLDFKGGKVLEIGPGTGKFASMLINKYNILHYTILDLKKNIKDSMELFRRNGWKGTFIESKDYEQIFNTQYDILISNFCLSETPDYYRESILQNVLPNCKSVFIVDGDSDREDYNAWLEKSVRDNFNKVVVEKTNYCGCLAILGEK